MIDFTSHTLRSVVWGDRVARILVAAIQAVSPSEAIARHMTRKGNQLIVDDLTFDLNRIERVLIIGAGKAGEPMALATAHIIGKRLTSGIVIVKEGYSKIDNSERPPGLQILEAGHPLPDQRSVEGASQIAALLSNTTTNDLVICLISGGGSALLVSPADDLTLANLQSLTATLLASGASINELNVLRKHLDKVKGGGLARMAVPANLITLILSDVVGDTLDVIASGPTVPDTSTFADAYKILERYSLLEQVPQAVVRHLTRGLLGDIPENPKPGDPLFSHVHNVIIGNNMKAAQAALRAAQAEGFQTLILTTSLQGEARHVGRALAAIARQITATGHPIPPPACIIAGGETTVTVLGDGLGGRNQELALASVTDLDGLPETALVTLATDGGDGPTDAAGAIVTGKTLERARQLGMHPTKYLDRNDAYHFFESLGDLLKPGPTLTNVNDLNFIFAI